jgi:formylglycine-generating enzyme required for sulfatase activity
VAQSLNNLALLYEAQGQYAQAEPLYKRSLAIWEKALGPNHPNVAESLNNLAVLYKTQGRYAQAEPLLRRSVAIQEKALGLDHPSLTKSLENLAALCRATNRTKEAEVLEKRAAAIRGQGRWETTNRIAFPRADTTRMRVPPGFKAKDGTTAEPYTNTGWAKEIAHEKTGIELVFIPSGEFLMGSPASETGRNENETQHKERISKPFYMGTYEVTQGEWQKVIGNNPSTFKGSDRLPVEQVSWNGCQAFCQRAGSGLRLPTEAEWEYACRAGTQTRYLSGDTDSSLGDCAWYTVNSGNQTHPVGQKRPNAWGLYDMQGNVLEWCADYWYRENPGVGTARVRRGSCWGGGPRDCRSGSSDRASPDHTDYNNGFRVALDLLGKTELTLPVTGPDKGWLQR